jgi:integrase
LQLSDLNFLGRSIEVRRQIQGSSIASAQLVPPKFGSERTVYVPGELMTSLSAHIAGEGLDRADDMVFRTPLGRLWQRNNAGEEWRRIRSASKLDDDVTLHNLRHTFASNLIASGVMW